MPEPLLPKRDWQVANLAELMRRAREQGSPWITIAEFAATLFDAAHDGGLRAAGKPTQNARMD